MHDSVLAWVAAKVAEHDLAGRDTLEVGSYDVNGTVRPLFTGRYVGVDMRDGPGVDHRAYANCLPFKPASFDVVVCTEVLEHDSRFWQSVKEMGRVLRKDGLVLLTARGIGFPRHDYPGDYWRFTPDAFATLFEHAELNPLEISEDPEQPGVFGVARKWR